MILGVCGYALADWTWFLWGAVREAAGAEARTSAALRGLIWWPVGALFARVYARGGWRTRQAGRLLGGFVLLMLGVGAVLSVFDSLARTPRSWPALVLGLPAPAAGASLPWEALRGPRRPSDAGTAPPGRDDREHDSTLGQRLGHLALALALGALVAVVRRLALP